MTILFLHGVPDTPKLWTPLISELGLSDADYLAPAMPGFGNRRPRGFSATKEGYLDWLTETVEAEAEKSGPLDVVGHDWGAALVMRLAATRPELIKSWVVADAILSPELRWHKTARIWQTPVYGELFMMMARPARLETMLIQAGMPEALAVLEAGAVDGEMKSSILKLYRSAKNMATEWANDLSGLPAKGLVIWGDKDPFVRIRFARAFCDAHPFPLHVEEGAGHWSVCERPASIAARLREFWA